MDPAALAGGPNLKAVFVAVLLMQLTGFAFYAPKAMAALWLKAWKLDPKKVKRKDPVPFVVSLLSSSLAAMTLDFFMRHLGWTGLGGGLRLALYVWLAFSAGGLAMHYRFAQVSGRALLLDAAHDLAHLCVAAAVLGLWR